MIGISLLIGFLLYLVQFVRENRFDYNWRRARQSSGQSALEEIIVTGIMIELVVLFGVTLPDLLDFGIGVIGMLVGSIICHEPRIAEILLPRYEY